MTVWLFCVQQIVLTDIEDDNLNMGCCLLLTFVGVLGLSLFLILGEFTMPATKKTTRNARTRNNDITPADAWANIEVTDNNGVIHRLPKGSPLYLDGRSVEKGLIQKAIAVAEKGESFTIQATLTITVASEDKPAEF